MILAIAIASTVIAQQVPQGMKYQAVARNLKGEILADEKIVLKISLTSQQNNSVVVHYTELHNIKTNELGLFSLVIGEGASNKATFKEIPWSSENIWMEVSIADRVKGDFTIISSSKLLAVPYAFHAGTANRVVDGKTNLGITAKPPEGGGGGGEGTDAQVWQLFGNVGTTPTIDKLGTTDANDLRIVTNDIERMRVLSNGNISMVNDLTVGKNVYLNTTPGETINNGNFTVANMSSTYLSGSLTADKLIRFTDGTQSNSSATGALVVTGGVGIEKNLNVGGDLNVAGLSTLKNLAVEGVDGKSLTITDNAGGYLATFENTNNGTGDGIKIKLGRRHALHPSLGTSAFTLPTLSSNPFANTTSAFQNYFDNLRNTQGSFNAGNLLSNVSAGAIADAEAFGVFIASKAVEVTNVVISKVNEGIGKVNTALSLPYNIATPINNALNLPYNFTAPINNALGLPVELNVIELFNNSGTLADAFIPDAIIPENGITFLPAIPAVNIPAIPNLILPSIPAIPTLTPIDPGPLGNLTINFAFPWDAVNDPLSNENEFIGFFDKNGTKCGAIRGESIGDWFENYFDVPWAVGLATTILTNTDIDDGISPISAAKYVMKLVDLSVGFGYAFSEMGVEYSSGNGDYAEWLERSDPNESISYGDIVAVKGGKITKNLSGAEQIMAVSHRPIVLGNVPEKSKMDLGNNIAFMGQIPVKIMGSVKAGDYIVAKSDIPGYGIAIDPLNMQIEDYKLAVGRSWTTNEKHGPKLVNTVVGVHNNSFLDLIKELKEKTEENDTRLKAIEAKLNISNDSKIGIEKRAFK
jgi:hypothetical protein